MSVTASLHKNRRTTLERVEKFISTIYFTDVNLTSKIYEARQDIDISHWALPVDQKWKDVAFATIKEQQFSPVNKGTSFGPTWATHWFRVTFTIPVSWTSKEVHLIWNSSSEAMLYSTEGHPLQGFTGCPDFQKREEFILSRAFDPSSPREFEYFIEMACNDMFGAGKNISIGPPDLERQYILQKAEIAVFNRDAYNLMVDLELLYEMAKELTEEGGKGDARGYQALYTANSMINLIQSGDYQGAAGLSSEFFSRKNGSMAHTIDAMGHCHIDTAWLWPFDETIRKCARSWSSVLTLMKEYPDFTFVCSQAQQYQWVKQYYPTLYEEIKAAVQRGRFIPVGGTWIEMDGNIPSGESFIRQFLYGQRFFFEEFGIHCQEFWLPDTFGYSAQTPQIMKHMGISRFLTQKLSWSLVNKFPHHNFWWEGIDGTSVLVHFPPGDSYEANCKISEALKTERNLQDKGRVSHSVMLYGFGDGGGGPHRPMLERLRRLSDVDGIPKLQNSTPKKFFDQLESEGKNLCRWVGELYLELHNGTYTSQADMKKYNRLCELQLRNAELLLSVAMVTKRLDGDTLDKLMDKLLQAWRLLMVNQFHDVLPGSSIEIVHQEARVFFLKSLDIISKVQKLCLEHLLGPEGNVPVLVNTLPWPRFAVVSDGKEDGTWSCVRIPGMGVSKGPSSAFKVGPIQCEVMDDVIRVRNGYFDVVFDKSGRIQSMEHLSTGNEAIQSGNHGNQLVLYDDIPLYWDAWDCMDYHLETRKPVNIADNVEPLHVESVSSLRVVLAWSHSVGEASTVKQRIHIDVANPYVEFETVVQWAENRKFLKVEFPLNVHCSFASFETQFGLVTRPTHVNTSWDSAKFEVCGHKWADLSEPNWGVAVLNDSKYGWSVRGHCLTLSLLRSPKAPDANCDMHEHRFRYALMPHEGRKTDVIRAAYEFNCPLILANVQAFDTQTQGCWFEVSDAAVILDTVKPCERDVETHSRQKAVVLRLYESTGGRTKARIKTTLPFTAVQEINGLEQSIGSSENLTEDEESGARYFTASFKPFQIRSFLLFY